MSPSAYATADRHSIKPKGTEQTMSFIKNLECLYFSNTNKRSHNQEYPESGRRHLLLRQNIDAFEEREYVSISYTLDPSLYEIKEDLQHGKYILGI